MKIEHIITSILIVISLAYLMINAKKINMNKIENNYSVVENDPLNARIYTLDNGLKVYLTVYKDAPRLQTNIAVRAGSKNDPSDATGLAHYLEHMLFKGTDVYGTLDYMKEKPLLDKIESLYEEFRTIPMTDTSERDKIWRQIDSISNEAAKFAIANEYDKMVTGLGAKRTNAYTSNEKTVYINDIPSNQLEKWLKLEAERFRNPVFRLFHTELETVYEEKNRGMDNDGRKMFKALMDGLFPNHQYGQQTTIGTIEHLKNPSLMEIRKYFNKYYVPNNMAICLSGDFDYDETIRLVEKYWGSFERQEDPVFEVFQEESISSPVYRDVFGPEAERLYVGFRFNGANTEDALMVSMIDMLLSNSVAGLIDINLNQTQEIMGGGSWNYILQDYSIHTLYGSPSQGQSLEEVKDLLLSQIDELKSGNFADWLMEAIISDLKLSQIKRYETNNGRANDFVQAFTLNRSWEDYQNQINELEKITKEDVVDFVNERYSDNYVVVYKRNGVDNSSVKVTKPEITPVRVNREDQSDFLVNLLSERSKEIEPVFIDFNNDILKSKLGDVDLIYKQNNENQRFQMKYVIDMGKDHNKKLSLAVDYLNFLGTETLSPTQKQQELYRLGCDLSVSCTNDKTQITLSGLSDNFDNSVKLLEDLLSNAVADDMALQDLKLNTLKSRADAKLNKQTILWGAMSNYAKYGERSSFTNILSEEELKNITSSDLLEIIHSLPMFSHRILYYGPENLNDLTSRLDGLHVNTKDLRSIPDKTIFLENEMKEPVVYVLDYDMKQAEVLILSKGEKLNIDNYSAIKFHNEYFGGGMSSIVFQDMREARALAYSVYSTYRIPSKKEDYHYSMSYIGTQSDKLEEAIDGMNGLLNVMPEAESNMKNAKKAILQKIRTERLTKSQVLNQYESAMRMGLDYDIRKDLFNQVENFNMDTLKDFHDTYISNETRVVMVLGSKNNLDLNVLEKYGTIKHLTLEDVFGY